MGGQMTRDRCLADSLYCMFLFDQNILFLFSLQLSFSSFSLKDTMNCVCKKKQLFSIFVETAFSTLHELVEL
jgi:hypothetical protein